MPLRQSASRPSAPWPRLAPRRARHCFVQAAAAEHHFDRVDLLIKHDLLLARVGGCARRPRDFGGHARCRTFRTIMLGHLAAKRLAGAFEAGCARHGRRFARHQGASLRDDDRLSEDAYAVQVADRQIAGVAALRGGLEIPLHAAHAAISKSWRGTLESDFAPSLVTRTVSLKL